MRGAQNSFASTNSERLIKGENRPFNNIFVKLQNFQYPFVYVLVFVRVHTDMTLHMCRKYVYFR